MESTWETGQDVHKQCLGEKDTGCDRGDEANWDTDTASRDGAQEYQRGPG